MIPETYYHIYNHANGTENLFRNRENYRFFLQKYALFVEPVADTFAYCLMPNHIHFLVRIKKQDDIEKSFGKFETCQKLEQRLSKQFANLFSCYTQSYNKVFNRRGSLFIPNFKRKEISNEKYFTNIVHYIHSNPVHHGFCKSVVEWEHSSYHSIIHLQKTKLKRQELISWFGSKERFINFHVNEYDFRLAVELDI